MRLSPLIIAIAGCGSVHFTDPNAPLLFRSTMVYSAGAVSEPTIWLPIVDVFDESPGDCANAQTWTLKIIRGAMLAADQRGVELAGAVLGCTQAPTRTLDVAALQQQIQSAIAARPAAHAKVVVVYANNIALPAPDAIAGALTTLRGGGLLWTVCRAPVSTQIASDQTMPWTFTYDVALQGQLATSFSTQLPLQSDTQVDSGPRAILGRADLPKARAAKICSATPGLSFVSVAESGVAFPVSQAQPPQFRALFQQRYAVPKSQFTVQQASFEVEGCEANCTGYFAKTPGDLHVWETTRGCFLEGP